MSQSESGPTPVRYNVAIAQDPSLPISHVNVLDLRASIDEFYFTLGVAPPPRPTELAEVVESGREIMAQPVFSFAVSRETMQQFLSIMAGQFDQQTEAIRRLRQSSEEASKKEAGGNE